MKIVYFGVCPIVACMWNRKMDGIEGHQTKHGPGKKSSLGEAVSVKKAGLRIGHFERKQDESTV